MASWRSMNANHIFGKYNTADLTTNFKSNPRQRIQDANDEAMATLRKAEEDLMAVKTAKGSEDKKTAGLDAATVE